MRRYLNVSNAGIVAGLFLMAVGVILMGLGVSWLIGDRFGQPSLPMPAYSGSSDGRFPVGTLPCGTAYLETLHDNEVDTVVWFLDDKIVAIVFINKSAGHYTYFLDKDLDGQRDEVGTGFSGDGSSASDFYKQVKGCGDGWFQ